MSANEIGLDLRNCGFPFIPHNTAEEGGPSHMELHFGWRQVPDFLLELVPGDLVFFEDAPRYLWQYLGDEENIQYVRHEFLFASAGMRDD